MLNRIQAPEFKSIETIATRLPKKIVLPNQIPLYHVNEGSQDVLKVEFVYKAGHYYQDQPLLASLANEMTECGTKKYTADELSERLDFFGSYFETGSGIDYASVSLYTLSKYLTETLPYLEDMLKNSVFPKDELEIMLSTKKQQFHVQSQKVKTIAKRKYSEILYGKSHPYGIVASIDDFDKIDETIIKDYYNRYYSSRNCFIIVSGKVDEKVTSAISKHFGNTHWGSEIVPQKVAIPFENHSEREFLIEKADAIQSAIKIGRVLFNRQHKDYFKFQVMNTVLGGYFGSRLMSNIREDKGYTYGIGSSLSPRFQGGEFSISTEVGCDVTAQTIEEVYKEIKTLQTEKVSKDELTSVKNYFIGNLLRGWDGPFNIADNIKVIIEHELNETYFDDYFNAVKQVTSDDVIEMANTYLKKEDLKQLVAGKM